MLTVDIFATRYGWSEEQIMETSHLALTALPLIWQARDDVAERRIAREEAARKAKGGGVVGGRA